MAEVAGSKIAEAFVEIHIDLRNLEAELKKAETATKKTATGMEAIFKKTGSAIQAIPWRSIALGASAAGAAVVALTKKSLDFTSEIVDTARGLGISTDALQELRFAAAQTGVSVESLNNSLFILSRQQGEALTDTAGPAADAFHQLGISIEEVRNLRPDELFTRVVQRLGELQDAGQRASVGQALLGRGFKDITKLVTEGAEAIDRLRAQAHELGLVINEETLVAAEAAGDKFDALFQILRIEGVVAVAQFAEELAELADLLLRAVPAIKEFFDRFRDTENLKSIGGATTRVAELRANLEALQRGKADALSGIFPPPEHVLKAHNDAIKRVQQELDIALAKQAELTVGRAGGGAIPPAAPRGGSGLNDPLARLKEEEEARRKAHEARVKADEAHNRALETEIELLAQGRDLVEEAVRGRLRAEGNPFSLISESRARTIEEIERTIEDETARREAIAAVDERFNAEVLAAQKEVEEAKRKEFDKTLQVQREGLDEFNDAFGNALADMLGIEEQWAKDMFRIFFKEFVLKAVESLAGIQSLGDFGGGLVAAFGAVGGALGFQHGGITTRPTFAMLSEHGQRETVVPFDIRDLDVGGNVEVLVNNYGPTPATARTGRNPRTGRQQILVEVAAMVAEDISRNGASAKAIESRFGLSAKGQRIG